MIEEGTYRARPYRAVLGESNTGKEQVVVSWELLDGSNQRINSYHYFSSDEAIRISMEQLRTAGFKGNDLMDLSSLFPDGNPPESELVIVHEEYQGKWSAKVRFVNSPGGVATAKPLDATKAKAFAARMRGPIAAFDAAKGTPSAPASRPAPPARPANTPKPPPPPEHSVSDDWRPTDDDVPF